MVVEEIMTEKPVTGEANQSVGEIIAAMLELDARHLPIMDGGRLVGIISDRDLRSQMMPVFEMLDAPEEARARLNRPISDLMAGDVISLDPETDVGDAVDMMLEQKIGAIPVVSADSGDLVGILSYVDVLRAARDLL